MGRFAAGPAEPGPVSRASVTRTPGSMKTGMKTFPSSWTRTNFRRQPVQAHFVTPRPSISRSRGSACTTPHMHRNRPAFMSGNFITPEGVTHRKDQGRGAASPEPLISDL